MPWRRDRLPTPVLLGFPSGSAGKESACNVGDLGSIPGLGRSLGGGHSNPLQYSCLENPHGQRSLANHSLWGHKESDMTEWLSTRAEYIMQNARLDEAQAGIKIAGRNTNNLDMQITPSKGRKQHYNFWESGRDNTSPSTTFPWCLASAKDRGRHVPSLNS